MESVAANPESHNVEALIVRLGFGGPLYYSYNQDPPPQNSIGNYFGLFLA